MHGIGSIEHGGGDRLVGNGGRHWLDATSLTGDIVVEQADTQYDRNGNPVFLTSKQLNPDGATYRTSHSTNWYDQANRLIDTGCRNVECPRFPARCFPPA